MELKCDPNHQARVDGIALAKKHQCLRLGKGFHQMKKMEQLTVLEPVQKGQSAIQKDKVKQKISAKGMHSKPV